MVGIPLTSEQDTVLSTGSQGEEFLVSSPLSEERHSSPHHDGGWITETLRKTSDECLQEGGTGGVRVDGKVQGAVSRVVSQGREVGYHHRVVCLLSPRESGNDPDGIGS